jgi:hypothetical protein
MRDKRRAFSFRKENIKERDHWGDLDIDERIMF